MLLLTVQNTMYLYFIVVTALCFMMRYLVETCFFYALMTWHHFTNNTVISSCSSLIWSLFFTCINRNMWHSKNRSAACCPFSRHSLYYWKYPDFWLWIPWGLRFEDRFSCRLKSSEDCLILKMKMKTKQFFEKSVNIYKFARHSVLDFSTVDCFRFWT